MIKCFKLSNVSQKKKKNETLKIGNKQQNERNKEGNTKSKRSLYIYKTSDWKVFFYKKKKTEPISLVLLTIPKSKSDEKNCKQRKEKN